MYEEQKREAHYKTPQRLHDYGASDGAKDSRGNLYRLFSQVWK